MITIFGSDLSRVEPFLKVMVFLIFGLPVLMIELVIGLRCRDRMKSKGYANCNSWFFIGFFLSFIGLIICLCMPDKGSPMPPGPGFEQYVNPPVHDRQMEVQCPQCGAMNPTGSNFCNGCGNKLN